MKRALVAAVAVALSTAAEPLSAQSQTTHRSALHDYRMVTVAEGLVNPWSMAFLPGGDILITERPGRLRIVRNGRLLETPVAGVPEVVARGQGGLLDVVLHPGFISNRLVYISFSKRTVGDSATTGIIRARFENDRLTNVEEIFTAQTRGQAAHFGSRLAFDREGYLFITVGDRAVAPAGDLETHPAQDLSNHHGTVIRLHDDGRVPADNPFTDRPGARPEIWSYGHRNMQGLFVHPETGTVWLTEHGPQGGDELNLVKKGANYGWPVIGFGVNYRTGSAIHSGTHREGMTQPSLVWVPSIGASGLLYYTGDKFPEWRGNVFAGGLVGEQLARITLNGESAELAEVLVRHMGRIRDVRQGLDGFIYLAIEDRQGAPTSVVRLEPVGR